MNTENIKNAFSQAEGTYSLRIKKAGETVFEGSNMQGSEVYAQLDDRIARGFDCELRADGRLMSAIWFYLHYTPTSEKTAEEQTEEGKVDEAETLATSTSEGITVYTGVILHPRQAEKHFRTEGEAKDYLMQTKKGAHIEVLIPGEERISGFRDTDNGDLSDFTNNALRAWLKGELGRYKDNLKKKASRAHIVSI